MKEMPSGQRLTAFGEESGCIAATLFFFFINN